MTEILVAFLKSTRFFFFFGMGEMFVCLEVTKEWCEKSQMKSQENSTLDTCAFL